MTQSSLTISSSDDALKEEGFDETDVIRTKGEWPITIVLMNRENGKLNRTLLGYYDVFLPTRAITLHEITGGMRRKKFHYKRGLIGFNGPHSQWSIEWIGRIEGVTLIFEADVIHRAAQIIFGENAEDLTWRTALSDDMPAIAYLGLDIVSQAIAGYPTGRAFVDRQILTLISMILRRYASTNVRQTAKVGIRSPQVLRAINYIDSHLNCSLTTQGICEVAASSSSHLNKLFRKEVGKSVWSYVIAQKMAAAALDIRTTSHPVDQIAKSYGFSSRATFSNQFKKRFGSPPGHYRKSISGS